VANLVESGDVAPLAASDVIFCRNVFIYFSDDAIRRTTRTFVQRMPDDGYVFLGASESLTRLSVELDLVEVAGAFAYIKHPHRVAVERERVENRGAALRRVAP
jgi:chemotaxis protein methyltransferase CheR